MFELEVKARTSARGTALDRLAAAGGQHLATVRQEDVVFATRLSDVTDPRPGTRILRLRQEAGTCVLTIKQHRHSELDCEEHQVRVENVADATAVIDALGYREVVRVHKIRELARLGRYNVCIDTVDGLGDFVEIELLTPGAATEVEASELEVLLAQLADGVRVFKGYDRLLLEQDSTVA